jgi:hypothetical protein
MKTIASISLSIASIAMTMFALAVGGPNQLSVESEAKAQALAAQDEGPAQVGRPAPLTPPVAPVAPVAPEVEPTPEPVPEPAPVPPVVPEGFEVVMENECTTNAQGVVVSCRMVPRLRPIARAAKAVGSVLVAPVRMVQNIRSAGCANPDCVCDPCECENTTQAYAYATTTVYATEGEVIYRAAPVRTVMRSTARGVARVVTAPVRLVRNLRCR